MVCETCLELKAKREAIEVKLNSRDLSLKHRLELNADLDPIAFVLRDHTIWHSNGFWAD